jgi:uncharacterized membrane protein YeaQ/YmgE (transglycosylase-associated protein family)
MTFGILLFCIFPTSPTTERIDTGPIVAMRTLVTAAIGAVVSVATGWAVYAVSNSPISGGVIVWSDVHLGAMEAILLAILGAVVATEIRHFHNRSH